MARLWTACDENLPDCRRLLLQTVKECLRQILMANAHAAGSAVPVEAERLAELIPDINEHTPAVRLSRRLLHPDPTCRSRY
ncbi:TPA: hypothetical protein ACH3X1_012341 [Trebouxia sp. C0004]